jgi:ankyrin repeat protein
VFANIDSAPTIDETSSSISATESSSYVSAAENFISIALDGDIVALKEQLASGIDPNIQNDRGWTALMASVIGNHGEVFLEVFFFK